MTLEVLAVILEFCTSQVYRNKKTKMAESTYSRKLDAMGRIMIPVRLRDQLGLITGREYSFEVRQIDGRNYICIDCGLNTELEEAMKLVQNAGLKVVKTDD